MINWKEQWELFAPGFVEGVLPIDLQRVCPREFLPVAKKICLGPGPGFGDLSHPTTQLMLNHLYRVVKGKKVLDIGCGSGILSLASCGLGAQSVMGLDIDEDAVTHARENAALNGFEDRVEFYLSAPHYPEFEEGVILMNMITSEQAIAVKMLPRLKEIRGDFLISGMLETQVNEVIGTYSLWGWRPVFVSTTDCWSIIHFVK